MTKYMLGTVISSYIKKRSHEAVLSLLTALPIGAVRISVITKSELLSGVEVSPRRARDAAALAGYLRHVEVIDFRDETAAHSARIRCDLRTRGMMIGANDLFIAAHARALGPTLVTNDTGGFGRVAHLMIENWAERAT